jgi:hypothetical protein
MNGKYTVIKLNLYIMVHSNVWKFEKIWLSGTLIIIFDYSVFHIYRSWVMALFLLENMDFLGFRMIFKVHRIVLKFEKIWFSRTLISSGNLGSPYFPREKGP